MKKNIALVFLVLASLACNLGSTPTDTTQPSTTEESAPQNESTPVVQDSSQHACDNPYVPIVVGATWTYDLKGQVSDTYVHSILSIDGNTFVEQDAFGTGVTRQGQWNCENGNLIALNPSGGGSTTVATENGVSIELQATELKGITLPAVINAGDTWSQEIFLEGTQTITGNSFPASNRTISTCQAIGVESVTVIAGTFDAMKVECLNKITVTLEMQAGSPTQFDTELATNTWYTIDVGMVKSTHTGSGLDSVIELVSYSIP